MMKVKKLIIAICIVFNGVFVFGQNIGEIASAKWLRIGGYVSAGYTNIQSDNQALRNINPNIFNFSTGLNLNIKGFNIPFNFLYSSDQGSEFRTRTVSRVGLKPSYKWIKFHLGESNLSFSPYTYSGTTFRGLGVEITPGKFRFAAFRGNLDQSYFAPTTSFQVLGEEQELYTRKGQGVKIGYGSYSNHMDFYFFKAKDEMESANQDSLRLSGFYPSENLALGTQIHFKIKSVFVEFNVAGSAFTEDQNAIPASSNETDLEVVSRFEDMLTINSSSRYSLAYDGRLGFNLKSLSLAFKYQHIDPYYTSLGIPFINDDLDHYLVDFNMNLAQGKFNLSGSYGKEFNNTRSYFKLSEARDIGSLFLSWSATKRFSINGHFNNFSASNAPSVVEVGDTIAYASSNFSLGTTLSYRLGDPKNSKAISLSLNQSTFNFQEDGELVSSSETRTYNLAFKHHISALKFNYGLGFNLSDFDTHSGLGVSRQGLNLSLSKTILKIFRLGLKGQALLNNTDNQSDGRVFNIGLTSGAQLKKGLNFSLTTRYVLRQTTILDPINTINTRIQLKKNF